MCVCVCVQVKLYEDFACSKAKKEVEDTLAEDEEGEREEIAVAKVEPPPTHIFQAMQYCISSMVYFLNSHFRFLLTPITSTAWILSMSLVLKHLFHLFYDFPH